MSFDRNLLPDPQSYYESLGLTLKGPARAKWKTTRCEFHGGSDSMRVNMANGAFKCMACGVGGGDVLAYHIQSTGHGFVDAAKALGAWVNDGKQPQYTPKPKSLPPTAALEVLGIEATVVAVVALDVAKGKTLNETDKARLMIAAGRIHRIAGEYSPC
jgi:hypothetical protein